MDKRLPRTAPLRAALLGTCLLLACPRQEASVEVPAQPPPAARVEERSEHYAEIELARDALIDGDLPAASAQGAALAARLPLPAALPREDELRAEALALAAAPDLAAAAGAVGRLSAACGGCHQAAGASVRLAPLPTPPQDEGFGAQMQRYHWSVQRMWQGLAQPDPAASAEALAALNHLPAAPFRPDWLDEMPIAGEMMDEAIHSVAADAIADGEAYGRLLANCAVCHQQIRDGEP